jgi:hypothetical protein
MSVEEARNDVVEAIDSGDWGGDGARLADRLILEAQAEMPCYRTKDKDGRTAPECWGYNPPLNPYQPCPSCAAKAKLKELAPV